MEGDGMKYTLDDWMKQYGLGDGSPSYSKGEKPSNPKDNVGVRKAPICTVPLPVLSELGVAMLEGSLKYGRHNYRTVGVRTSVYVDAVWRHLSAYWEGEDSDPDSGLSHITKAMACLAVLRDSEMQGNINDDRPPKSPHSWQQVLNERAAKILDKFPNPVEPHLEKTK